MTTERERFGRGTKAEREASREKARGYREERERREPTERDIYGRGTRDEREASRKQARRIREKRERDREPIRQRDREPSRQRDREPSITWDRDLGEGFSPPPGSTQGPLTATGAVEWYVKDNIKYYTPASTMWTLGYRTSEEYTRPQRLVKDGKVTWVGGGADELGFPAPHPTTTSISRSQLQDAGGKIPDFSNLTKREQFYAMVREGIIESGSVYGGDEEGPGKRWSYYTPTEITKGFELGEKFPQLKRDRNPVRELRGLRETRQLDEMAAKSEKEMAKTHIKLKDDKWVPLSQWNTLPEKYQRIGLRQGYDAMQKAYNSDHMVIGDQAMTVKDWNSLPDPLKSVAINQGFDAMQDKVSSAEKLLGSFKEADGYNIGGALLTRDKDIVAAVELLFNSDDVKKVRHKLMPGLTIGTGEAQRIKDGKKGPAPSDALLAAVAATFATPIPHDDLVALVVLGSLAGLGAAGVVKGVEISKADINKWVADMEAAHLQAFTQNMRGAPNLEDVLLARNTAAISLKDATQMAGTGTKFIPPQIEATKIEFKPPTIEALTMTKFIPPNLPRYQEGVKLMQPEAMVLFNPQVTPEKVMGDSYNVLKAAREAKEAGERIKRSITTKTMPRELKVDWDKIVDKALAKTAGDTRVANADIEEAFGNAYRIVRRLSPDVAHAYFRAYQEYLKRRLALEAAKRSYVASLNPKFIKGKATDELNDVIAAYAVNNALALAYRNTLKQSVKVGIATYSKLLTKGATRAEARAKAETAAKANLKHALSNLTDTSTATQTQTKTLTRTLTRALTRTLDSTLTPTAVATGVAAMPLTIAATATTATPLPIPPRLRLGGDSESEKRKRISRARGAIAFRMGELHDKDVWHVVISPYQKGDYIIIYGKRPIGATIVRGPDSAVKTAQLLYGKTISKTLRLDIGAVDATMEPISGRKGIRLSFSPDPLQKTTGDITVGRTRKAFPLPK